MFRITLLPAEQGDALWIEYGKGPDPKRPRRILIDGGVHATGRVLQERIEALPKEERVFELGVVTHVDLDHVLGMLQLLKQPPAGLRFDDFWFNGWRHLPKSPSDTSVLGAKMGEQLSQLLLQRPGQAWNAAFKGKAVSVGSDLPAKASALKVVRLPGGMRLTILGPTGKRLAQLKPVWKKEIQKAGLTPGRAGKQLMGHPEDADDTTLGGDPPAPRSAADIDRLAARKLGKDASKANGSSIVLLAEYEKKKALLTGDAFPDDVLRAVNLLAQANGANALAVQCWKLAHHGGEKNTSRELAAALECPLYLISTSGAKYRHPKVVSIARVLNGRPPGEAELAFNYDSKYTAVWSKPTRFAPKYRYLPDYPRDAGMYTVEL